MSKKNRSSKKDVFDKKKFLANLDLEQCVFCNTKEEDGACGRKICKLGLTVHYFCMLFSSGLSQNGRSQEDGILGFLPDDIIKEVRRGTRLRCSFCKLKGATIGCVVGACRKVFHFGCGQAYSTLHQYFGNFSSFCEDHRPRQMIPVDRLSLCGKSNATCAICMTAVTPNVMSNDTIRAPCCGYAWFHRKCIQKHATTAGLYFFKCPLCNNKDVFQDEMLHFGIFIPDQDAAWELEPGAYSELLERYLKCDAALCKCPNGRQYHRDGGKWEVLVCDWCGAQGTHIGCRNLLQIGADYVCVECKELDDRYMKKRKQTKQHRRRSESEYGKDARTAENTRILEEKAQRASLSTTSSATSPHNHDNPSTSSISPDSDVHKESPLPSYGRSRSRRKIHLNSGSVLHLSYEETDQELDVVDNDPDEGDRRGQKGCDSLPGRQKRERHSSASGSKRRQPSRRVATEVNKSRTNEQKSSESIIDDAVTSVTQDALHASHGKGTRDKGRSTMAKVDNVVKPTEYNEAVGNEDRVQEKRKRKHHIKDPHMSGYVRRRRRRRRQQVVTTVTEGLQKSPSSRPETESDEDEEWNMSLQEISTAQISTTQKSTTQRPWQDDDGGKESKENPASGSTASDHNVTSEWTDDGEDSEVEEVTQGVTNGRKRRRKSHPDMMGYVKRKRRRSRRSKRVVPDTDAETDDETESGIVLGNSLQYKVEGIEGDESLPVLEKEPLETMATGVGGGVIDKAPVLYKQMCVTELADTECCSETSDSSKSTKKLHRKNRYLLRNRKRKCKKIKKKSSMSKFDSKSEYGYVTTDYEVDSESENEEEEDNLMIEIGHQKVKDDLKGKGRMETVTDVGMEAEPQQFKTSHGSSPAFAELRHQIVSEKFRCTQPRSSSTRKEIAVNTVTLEMINDLAYPRKMKGSFEVKSPTDTGDTQERRGRSRTRSHVAAKQSDVGPKYHTSGSNHSSLDTQNLTTKSSTSWAQESSPEDEVHFQGILTRSRSRSRARLKLYDSGDPHFSGNVPKGCATEVENLTEKAHIDTNRKNRHIDKKKRLNRDKSKGTVTNKKDFTLLSSESGDQTLQSLGKEKAQRNKPRVVASICETVKLRCRVKSINRRTSPTKLSVFPIGASQRNQKMSDLNTVKVKKSKNGTKYFMVEGKQSIYRYYVSSRERYHLLSKEEKESYKQRVALMKKRRDILKKMADIQNNRCMTPEEKEKYRKLEKEMEEQNLVEKKVKRYPHFLKNSGKGKKRNRAHRSEGLIDKNNEKNRQVGVKNSTEITSNEDGYVGSRYCPADGFIPRSGCVSSVPDPARQMDGRSTDGKSDVINSTPMKEKDMYGTTHLRSRVKANQAAKAAEKYGSLQWKNRRNVAKTCNPYSPAYSVENGKGKLVSGDQTLSDQPPADGRNNDGCDNAVPGSVLQSCGQGLQDPLIHDTSDPYDFQEDENHYSGPTSLQTGRHTNGCPDTCQHPVNLLDSGQATAVGVGIQGEATATPTSGATGLCEMEGIQAKEEVNKTAHDTPSRSNDILASTLQGDNSMPESILLEVPTKGKIEIQGNDRERKEPNNAVYDVYSSRKTCSIENLTKKRNVDLPRRTSLKRLSKQYAVKSQQIDDSTETLTAKLKGIDKSLLRENSVKGSEDEVMVMDWKKSEVETFHVLSDDGDGSRSGSDSVLCASDISFQLCNAHHNSITGGERKPTTRTSQRVMSGDAEAACCTVCSNEPYTLALGSASRNYKHLQLKKPKGFLMRTAFRMMSKDEVNLGFIHRVLTLARKPLNQKYPTFEEAVIEHIDPGISKTPRGKGFGNDITRTYQTGSSRAKLDMSRSKERESRLKTRKATPRSTSKLMKRNSLSSVDVRKVKSEIKRNKKFTVEPDAERSLRSAKKALLFNENPEKDCRFIKPRNILEGIETADVENKSNPTLEQSDTKRTRRCLDLIDSCHDNGPQDVSFRDKASPNNQRGQHPQPYDEPSPDSDKEKNVKVISENQDCSSKTDGDYAIISPLQAVAALNGVLCPNGIPEQTDGDLCQRGLGSTSENKRRSDRSDTEREEECLIDDMGSDSRESHGEIPSTSSNKQENGGNSTLDDSVQIQQRKLHKIPVFDIL